MPSSRFRRCASAAAAERMQHLHLSRVVAISCFLWAGVNLGCADHPTGPGESPFGQSFELRPGTSAILSDGLKVTFDGVRADSRCPMDALCVWAGDATVAVRLSQPPAAQAERALHTQTGGSEAPVPCLRDQAGSARPLSTIGSAVRPDDYVATLAVRITVTPVPHPFRQLS